MLKQCLQAGALANVSKAETNRISVTAVLCCIHTGPECLLDKLDRKSDSLPRVCPDGKSELC